MTDEPDSPDFERLLQYLRETRGFDFSGYKRTTLLRRVEKRMTQVGVKGHAAYLEYLQAHPEEFATLFNTILINVTSYFRDAAAWEYLRDEILPKIIEGKAPYEPIRVWSAGVASGEEAYSVAMLLSEALGASEYRERAKIYATDVDEDALTHARQGRAEEKDLEEVPQSLREKYFEPEGDHYLLRGELRRSIIFGRHDLVQDAPISRIDLLVCRNTLMYFEPPAQAKILARLHYALSEKGYLFLGKAEMLLRRDTLFVPLDLKQRIFNKTHQVAVRDQRLATPLAGSADPGNHLTRPARLRDLLADALPIAQLVVDTGGIVTSINERARSLFGLVIADVGRPLQDLEVSYRPLELRSMIDQAYRDRRPVEARDVERRPNAETQYFDVKVVPLIDRDNTLLGASIAFTDVTSYNRVNRELELSKQELETASEELQATNEELETTNEELQSTVEELETTNEELQSSNEELETMNEELESTNTELETINTELQQRSMQLDHINVFMEDILANVQTGVAVLDKDLRVQLWNKRSEDLWGVRASETVGQPLLGLDIGLPVSELVGPINEAIKTASGFREITVQSTNRRGKSFTCRVQCSAMAAINGGRGAILLMEAVEPQKKP
ncbi:MAG TPA: CheR family methyltransferase [Candidatus Dormibacteraeota bacterium]